jgi:hypothetical protein
MVAEDSLRIQKNLEIVVAGLDPAIHLLRKNFLQRWMDARVKPGHDGWVCSHTTISNRHSFAISPHISRELCFEHSALPTEGAGNAGRPERPRPRV